MESELQELRERLAALEKSDRHQTKRIELQRKVNMGCLALLVVGIGGQYIAISEESRVLLERAAVGAIVAGGFGALASNQLEVKED